MKKSKSYKQRHILPELYINYNLKRKLSPNEKDKIISILKLKTKDILYETLRHLSKREAEIEFEIILCEGSFITRIGLAIGSLFTFLAFYGAIRGGAEAFSKDIISVFNLILPEVRNAVGTRNIQDTIRYERRIGVLKKIDELIEKLQNNRINEVVFRVRVLEVLKGIKHVEYSQELENAIAQYIRNHFPEPDLIIDLDEETDEHPQRDPNRHLPGDGSNAILPNQIKEEDEE